MNHQLTRNKPGKWLLKRFVEIRDIICKMLFRMQNYSAVLPPFLASILMEMRAHVCVCMSTVTSTRWLSGPYKSFSNSMTRLLKNDENFRFTLPGSLAFTVYAQRCTYIHTVSQNKTWNPATFLHNFANTALMRVILGRENRQLILY